MATAEEMPSVSAMQHVGGHHFGTTGMPHSNKHVKERGLDRANDVAGEHGQHGRANATTHQSDNDSGSDLNSERRGG
jgi:hypothetical protein